MANNVMARDRYFVVVAVRIVVVIVVVVGLEYVVSKRNEQSVIRLQIKLFVAKRGKQRHTPTAPLTDSLSVTVTHTTHSHIRRHTRCCATYPASLHPFAFSCR